MLLALAMVVGFLPVAALDTLAAAPASTVSTSPDKLEDGVLYTTTVSPEVAILNRYNGNSQKFYDQIKNGQSNWRYDANSMFGFKYSFEFNDEWDYTWTSTTPLGEKSFYKLMEVDNNLEVGLSAELVNNHHTHSKKNYTVSVTAYEKVSLYLTDVEVATISSRETTASAKSQSSRVGDLRFSMISGLDTTKLSNESANKVSFRSEENGYTVKSKWYPSHCGGSAAKNVLICFRDPKDPKVVDVQYSTDGQHYTSWSKGTTYAVDGQGLYIKLVYDEPLRFADHDATGMNNLYILLQTEKEGTGSGQKAYLHSLNGCELVFKYTVNADELAAANYPTKNVTAFDLSPLFSANTVGESTIPLKHLYYGETFTVATYDDAPDGTNGFTTSTCYITDIAGNPLSSQKITGANLVLDTEVPYIEQVVFNANTNNAGVKAAMGKDQLTPGTTEYERDYADDSDLYLGVGDTLSFTLRMNEKLKLNLEKMETTGYTILTWNYATVTTNIKVPADNSLLSGYYFGRDNDGYLTVKSKWMNPYTYNGKDSGDRTVITTADITITSDMTVNDPNGEIKVTALTFDFTGANNDTKGLLNSSGYLTDPAGNVVENNVIPAFKYQTTTTNGGSTTVTTSFSNQSDLATGTTTLVNDPNENPYKLDVIAPVVSAMDPAYAELSTVLTGAGSGFRYSFKIGYANGETSSGSNKNCSLFENLNGSFVLNNGGDKMAYEYEYAVSATAEHSSMTELNWQTAVMGVSVSFKQTPEVYLYVRAKDGVEYLNLHNCTLTVTTSDYAGNVGTVTLPANGELGWRIDTTAPTVAAGDVTRALNGTGGTLTANVILTDTNGISSWQYAWSDSNTEAPTTWTDGSITPTTGSNPVTVSASASVEASSKYSKYLWVKAKDNSTGTNESKATCLGLYTYDLAKVKYALSYDAGFIQKAGVSGSDLDSDASLIFIIPSQYRNATVGDYHVLVVDSSKLSADSNIFEMDGWATYTYAKSGDIYNFTRTQSDAYMDGLKDGSYSGNLTVTVLAGRTAGLSFFDEGKTILTGAGNTSYLFSESSFTLTVTGTQPKANYVYTVSEDTSYITVDANGFDSYHPYISQASNWNGTTLSYDKSLLSTLEGVQLVISIPQDNYGWECRDIDIGRSYILLTNTTDSKTWQAPIGYFTKNSGGGYSQTVTLPAEDYTTGVYTAELKLYFKSDTSDTATPLTVAYEHPVDEYSFTRVFVVDATEAKPFTVDYISYGAGSMYNKLAINTVYSERSITESLDHVYYLPVPNGDLLTGRGTGYTLHISCAEDTAPAKINYGSYDNDFSYTNLYRIEIWNENHPTVKVVVAPEIDQKSVEFYNFKVGETKNGYVTLDANTENTVHIRKFYANGKAVETTITVKPVDEQLTGTLSVDHSTNDLVFTPTNADMVASFADAQVYAFAYQTDGSYTNPAENSYELIEMRLSSDNTWRCNLPENGAQFRVFTVTSYGSVWADSGVYATERAPWFDTESGFAPTVTDDGNGTYELSFTVYDDYRTMDGDWPEITVSFDKAYTQEAFTFTLGDIPTDYWGDYEEWLIGDVSATGIYSVTVQPDAPGQQTWGNDDSTYYDYLTVTIKGVYLPTLSEATDKNMGLTVTVRDRAGHRTTQSLTADANYQTPQLVDSYLTTTGLVLEFNQPVMPTETWAWAEEDDTGVIFIQNKGGSGSTQYGEGYKVKWSGAFPITGNGTHEIAVRDITGTTQIIEVDVDAFTVDGKDYSFTLDWSQTELTKDPVYLTAAMVDQPDSSAGITMLEWKYSETYGNYVEGDYFVPEGMYNGTETETTMQYADPHGNGGRYYTSTLAWSILNKYATSVTRTIKLEESQQLIVRVYNKLYSESTNGYIYSQTVHVDNIATSAPKATLSYSIASIGRSFTYDELVDYVGSGMSVSGDVVVTYTTTRNVTPTGETGTEFIFNKDNPTASHTFTFADDMGNEGSVTVALPTGLTLTEATTSPAPEGYTDTDAPLVSVSVYAKRSGSYTAAESFTVRNGTVSADLAGDTGLFANIGWVQGYRLVLSISDNSGYDLMVTGANGGALPNGITLAGGIITVDAAAEFTVTATDKSASRNSTTFTITAAMLDHLDNVAPTGTITVENISTYEKALYIALTDNSNSTYLSLPSDSVLVQSGATGKDATHVGAYKYTVKDNGEVTFVFYDEAGNRGEAKYTVTGVDTAPPELSVKWRPGYQDESGKSYPPDYEVNTDVTAIISSDKTLKDLTVAVDGTSVGLLADGTATASNPYIIYDYSNQPLVTISATADRITVTYSGYYSQELTFTATAPNGKQREYALSASVSIDKTAPEITETKTEQKKPGYDVPYMVNVKLEPNKDVISTNYGEITDQEHAFGNSQTKYKVYNGDNPALELAFTKNGTYKVNFTDRAGNVTIHTVTITGVDSVAPKITLGQQIKNADNTVSVEVTVDEACTIAWGTERHTFAAEGSHTITFTDNGSHLITATDLAGNQSDAVVVIANIDKILPTITFTGNTIYLMQNSSRTDLDTALNNGYTVSDNVTAADKLIAGMVIDSTDVKLDTAGSYKVTYTVTDEAGNSITVNRFVQVIGADTVCVLIDGNFVLPGGTAVVKAGEEHTLSLANCDEPYTVKARQGILTTGQMKYMSGSSLSFDENGAFTVNSTGYYTLLVTTQSRQTILVRLYIER